MSVWEPTPAHLPLSAPFVSYCQIDCIVLFVLVKILDERGIFEDLIREPLFCFNFGVLLPWTQNQEHGSRQMKADEGNQVAHNSADGSGGEERAKTSQPTAKNVDTFETATRTPKGESAAGIDGTVDQPDFFDSDGELSITNPFNSSPSSLNSGTVSRFDAARKQCCERCCSRCKRRWVRNQCSEEHLDRKQGKKNTRRILSIISRGETYHSSGLGSKGGQSSCWSGLGCYLHGKVDNIEVFLIRCFATVLFQ